MNVYIKHNGDESPKNDRVLFVTLALATTVFIKPYISNFLTHLIVHSLAHILHSNHHNYFFDCTLSIQGKAIPVQDWTGPEGSRRYF
jgi:hypothetical protein